MGIYSEFEKSRIFSDYIVSNGLKFGGRILEIGKPAECSLTAFLLKMGYSLDQFLLSEKIVYPTMDNLGIIGAKGHLVKSEHPFDEQEAEIYVAKTLYHDIRFLNQTPKLSCARRNYVLPSLSSFDALICEGVPRDLSIVPYTSLNKTIGFCLERYDENFENYMFIYESLLKCINERERNSYQLITDRDTNSKAELCLIKKKGMHH
jgi:hypothetical protein